MKPIVNGTFAPIRKPLKVTYDPSRGQQVIAEWESAGDNLTGIAASYQASRIQYDLTRSGAKSTLIAVASGGQAGVPDVSIDTWQVMANEIQKDLREHPAFQAMEASYPGTIGYVVRDVALYNQGQAPGSPAPDPTVYDTYSQMFQLLIRGVTHYALGQYVLRHTTNVSNVYQANVSDLNVWRVYTTAQLLIETGSTKGWVYPLPGRLSAKLQAIPAPAAQTGYVWGWLKKPSTESTTASNRIEISTEYWLEQWASILYPSAV